MTHICIINIGILPCRLKDLSQNIDYKENEIIIDNYHCKKEAIIYITDSLNSLYDFTSIVNQVKFADYIFISVSRDYSIALTSILSVCKTLNKKVFCTLPSSQSYSCILNPLINILTNFYYYENSIKQAWDIFKESFPASPIEEDSISTAKNIQSSELNEHSQEIWSTKLISLKSSYKKDFVLDERFWNNVNYITFHSEYIEIRLLHGRPLFYLHKWFYDELISIRTSKEERTSIFDEFHCTFRFIEKNSRFLNHLFYEAKKRKLIYYPED